ncbi:MAG: permease [Anaerolineae bacterium]|nr:permease [Anaerolineae bacterium]
MKKRNLFIALTILALLVGPPALRAIPAGMLWQQMQAWGTVFLGIFIEAVPFLLAGAVISGLISEFVEPAWLQRFTPRHPLIAVLAGTLLGLTFPVCECGVVPVTRRLYQKGLPLASGVTFLLAAPVLNPVVIVSTLTAYGWSAMFWGRIGGALLIAVTVGALFHWAEPEAILEYAHPSHHHTDLVMIEPVVVRADKPERSQRFWRALTVAGDEFLEMAQYLVIGCLLAAGMQILIPQSMLLAWGNGPVQSVMVMMLLAFILSVCSTVDAFVSLAFANTFAPGAVLAFLVFGPMVDLKSLLLFRQIFRPRATVYLVMLPLLMTAIFAIAYNMWGGQ